MKSYVAWLLLGGACAGCLPYPRFAHVYATPQYTGLFVDRQHRPVANVLVSLPHDRRQHAQTGPDGRAVLPARRRFQVIGFVVMDAWPRTVVRAGWADTTAGARGRFQHYFQHDHSVRFVPGQRRLTVIQDTVVLPL